jgi:uncharacterized SAM-binding protein YcdF (DUF218 family)
MPHTISYSALIPPNLFLLAALFGVVLAWRSPRLGLWLATAAIGSVYLLSTPLLAHSLIRATEALAGAMPRLPAPKAPAAIIVLGADMRSGAVAGEPDSVGPVTLERLAEAARLDRRLGLPILVSGGRLETGGISLADAMRTALSDDFRVPVEWREDRSRNTWENAAFSAAILRRAGVPSALVVTQPWHMARALWSFAAVGYPVRPAPTRGDARAPPASPAIFLPQVPALLGSYHALHELIGLLWYRIRYRGG